MILLLIAFLNTALYEYKILQAIIALIIFSYIEIKRKKEKAGKALIAAQIISALVLVGDIISFVVGFFY